MQGPGARIPAFRSSRNAVSADEVEAAESGAGVAMLSSPTTRRAVVSLFVTLFTIYPTVMQETLLLFSCKELEDGESYLLESMDMRYGLADILYCPPRHRNAF